jgi:hypothetical protein
MENTESNRFQVLVHPSNKLGEDDELHASESVPLRKNELHEETQGKLLEYKLSFALTVD